MELKRYRITILTTGQPSTNPRLVKEADTLAKMGYMVFVYYCYWSDWAFKNDFDLLENKHWKYFLVGGDNFKDKNKFLWTRVRRKLYLLTNKLIKNNLSVISGSLFRAEKELFRSAVRTKSDLYIAHNLGAFYPAYKAALRNKAKLAFDMEDYHPGEAFNENDLDDKRRREEILKRILPKCDYVSFATDGLLYETYKNITKNIRYPIIVYNSFPSEEFIEPKQRKEDKIKFVWFSQTIGRGRGLELFFEAIRDAEFDYDITLIGNFNDKEFEAELKQNKSLIIIDSLPQVELHKKLSEFDIGLSLELNGTDLNRNHALTNKLFAYLQAGLFVLATDTPAQKEFMVKNPGFGILCGQTPPEILKGIHYIKENIKDIRSNSIKRYNEAKKFAWENESKKLVEVWEKILS